MKPRLIILVAVAAVLAVGLALRTSAPPGEDSDSAKLIDLAEGTTMSDLEDQRRMVWNFPLPGEEPEEISEFDANVRVDTTSGKNRLVLEVTELHGHYVEYLTAYVWYAGPEGWDLPDSPLVITHIMNRYLPADKTIVDCFEVVPRELQVAGAEIGVDDHWEAEIVAYERARDVNPEHFPPVGADSRCGS